MTCSSYQKVSRHDSKQCCQLALQSLGLMHIGTFIGALAWLFCNTSKVCRSCVACWPRLAWHCIENNADADWWLTAFNLGCQCLSPCQQAMSMLCDINIMASCLDSLIVRAIALSSWIASWKLTPLELLVRLPSVRSALCLSHQRLFALMVLLSKLSPT